MENFQLDNMPNLRDALMNFLNDVLARVPESVRPESFEFTLNLDSIIIHLELDVRAASIIYGTKGPRRMPPVDAIKAWVERKHIQPVANSRGKVPSISDLSWAIAKSIALNGTPPHSYYDDVVSELLSQHEALIQEAFSKDIVALLDISELL